MEFANFRFSEHRYAMRGFGADADELFFSLADYARNPSQKQVIILLNKTHE